ncbi:amidophosphoribosyltransferase [Secundilactobacillus collinoides]|uniref:Amidophosphoribosyltransferase n=2 Tax=Secundilactobacillus collinoides TaxID=33960 RepID=A0A0R2B4Z3_SECCO|nr:amidophosphoribosyltransferase [Secundilactobacillus collinoides]KRM74154.1 amidophosphoribosyltransferase (atase) [Secundilactobacillus collinoides DSM 20515 = JCM 1123]KZL39203.1 amidophosphoribosyltransferase [Secundilactobacillus collinoides]
MPAEIKGLNEECGLFGIWGEANAAQLTYDGLHSLQHRGQEGAGIVSNDQGQFYRHRGLGLLAEVFRDSETIHQLYGTSAIGHVRYATAGNHGVENIQPMLFSHDEVGEFALAHNGNLTNADTIRGELREKGVTFQATSDSELLGELVTTSDEDGFINQLKASLNHIHGGFAYLLMTPHMMVAALDPNGFRPLVVGKMPDGATVICSETCALDQVGASFVRDVEPGEIIIVTDEGMKIDHFTTDTHLALCSMEYIYFARPDSIIRGISVHEARKRMGALVARENPVKADVVLGVPNSSLSAAIGYAQESGIPYDMGMIKNQYVARTFIEPTQAKRDRGVSMKLSVVKSVVAGKDIVLVDDSIVRGTTSKYIVRLLKKAGAKSVHVRIASPALKFPCYYGIDIQTTKELIAANNTIPEICTQIEADSLAFLSVPGLIKAIGDLNDADNHGLCTAYFDGNYPTPLYDYQAGFDAEVARLGLYEGANTGD